MLWVVDYSGIKINTRVAGGVLWVLACDGCWEGMSVGGGLTMDSGMVAVFWMCWRIVCPERSEGSQ